MQSQKCLKSLKNKQVIATMKKKRLNKWELFNNLDITYMSYIIFA